MDLYKVNNDLFYEDSEYVAKNPFLTMPVETADIPLYEEIKDRLPKPFWDGHEDAIKCYDYAWKTGFGNIRKADPNAGFVSNFIDTAFNGFLFMWDSSFIVMFGKYGAKIFDFQKTLDNFYSHQHKDGFICREICENQNGEHFSRFDPSATGPNIMPWSEWESYCQTGNKERLEKIFYPLLAYHLWLKQFHTWQDGSYWCTGLGCGMDNQLRGSSFSHGFLTWMDTCAQQVLSAKCIISMAKELGKEDEWGVKELKEEVENLTKIINEKLWDDEDAYYYDLNRDGSHYKAIKSVGSYWALLADIIPAKNLDRFIAHLNNEKEFKRPHRVPALSADSTNYDPEHGGYWNGAIWAPTNYMVLKGLEKNGYNELAYDIACNNLDNVVKVFNETGTLWENYAPDVIQHGYAKDKFVGWSGLFPISIMLEYVFGIRPLAKEKKIVWYVNRTERHGVKQYPLGSADVDIECAARKSADEEPVITVKASEPVTVEVHWGNKVITVKA